MKLASITITKTHLSALIDEVKRGETVIILDRGKPVARLVAAAGSADDETLQGLLERLERAGLLHRAEAEPDADDLAEPPPRLVGKTSAVRALLTERERAR